MHATGLRGSCPLSSIATAAVLFACSNGSNDGSPPEGGTGGAGSPSGGASFSDAALLTGGMSNTSSGGSSSGGVGIGAVDPLASIFRGIVVDASTATGFDDTKYTRLPGVEVCVYGDDTIPCATTTSSGDYEFDGAPRNVPFFFSYRRAGFDSVLYPVIPTASGTYGTPPIMMAPASFGDDLAELAGFSRDGSLGTIQFAAVTPGSSSDSPFFQMFNRQGFVYLSDYVVTFSPAAHHGPFYISEAWRADPTLSASSAAGWGFVTTTPGDYALTFERAAFRCGTAMAKVVAGYTTVYVGTVCSPTSDGGVDAGAKLEAGARDGSTPFLL